MGTRARRPLRSLACAGVCLCMALMAMDGVAQEAPASLLSVRNCVGPDTLEINLRGDAVMLDDADRRGVATAMGQRYAVLGPGFDPVAIVLWRRPGQGWLYVALDTPLRPPPAWCFSATFVAPVFDFTPALQRKYFAAGALRS